MFFLNFKRMRKIITLFYILITTIVFAQGKYNSGDALFQKMEYEAAAKLYETAIENGDASKEVLQKIGNAYYFNTNMKAANKWYGKLISTYKNDITAEYFFRYAQSFKGIGKLNAAKKWMKEFSESKSNAKENSDQFNALSEEKTQTQSEYLLKNISINTIFSDFAPMYYGDKLVYSSAKDSMFLKASKSLKKPPFLNLYIGNFDLKTADITSSKEFSKELNSNFHEATLCFSSDLKKVYYTRNSYNGKLYDGEDNKLKIYSATVKETENGIIEWGNFKELPFSSDKYSAGHPALSSDGKKLYFVSDMPGTIGETDIFVVDILDDDTYSQPKNMGPVVNSSKKEMFPFLTDNKMYFTSDRLGGFGGLDVYESEYNTVFKTPLNLGTTLNSVQDDFGYIVNEVENNGFVCSNRGSGKGDDDIYFFERTSAGICKQLIKGYISNNITGERVAKTTVSLYSENDEMLEEIKTDVNGDYSFQQELICDKEYLITVEKQGYKNTQKVILTTKSSKEIIAPIGVDRIHELIVEENGLLKIKIGTIYFDLNKYNIRKDAAIEFDKIVSLLNQYPKMVINIESHTDSRGPDAFNLTLSQKRAKAAKDYIISKGISAERIYKAEGFGETQLKNNCINGAPCSEAMHQLNRRSEFVIMKM